MQQLNYAIHIPAPPQQVWNTMLQHGTYEQWTTAFLPGSTYTGNWGLHERLKFTGPEGNGTVAEITAWEQYKLIAATHVAVVNRQGVEERASPEAQQWIGTRESYRFVQTAEGHTQLEVEMHTHPAFASMFDTSWPKALQALKNLLAVPASNA